MPNVEIDKELIHQIERFIKIDPEKRYRSKEDFIIDALTRFEKEHHTLLEASESLP